MRYRVVEKYKRSWRKELQKKYYIEYKQMGIWWKLRGASFTKLLCVKILAITFLPITLFALALESDNLTVNVYNTEDAAESELREMVYEDKAGQKRVVGLWHNGEYISNEQLERLKKT